MLVFVLGLGLGLVLRLGLGRESGLLWVGVGTASGRACARGRRPTASSRAPPPPCESRREAAGAPEGMVRLVCVWGPLCNVWVYLWGYGEVHNGAGPHHLQSPPSGEIYREIRRYKQISAALSRFTKTSPTGRALTRERNFSGTLSNNHRIM